MAGGVSFFFELIPTQGGNPVKMRFGLDALHGVPGLIDMVKSNRKDILSPEAPVSCSVPLKLHHPVLGSPSRAKPFTSPASTSSIWKTIRSGASYSRRRSNEMGSGSLYLFANARTLIGG
jgi:hypothetical protein